MPRIETKDLALYYESHGVGDPILFITGLLYDHWFWHRQVAALQNHFRVIVFDNRGAGQSDRPPGPYTVVQMADDAAHLLQSLEIPRAHIVGHSLGGFIAQELALHHPRLVDRLVLAGTSFGGPTAIPITERALQILTNREGDLEDLIRRGVRVATAAEFAEKHPEVFETIIRYRLTEPVKKEEHHYQTAAGVQHNAADRIHGIDARTLVLTGAEDEVVPPGNAERLASALPNATVSIIPGAGHIFPLEVPDLTNQLLIDFLTSEP